MELSIQEVREGITLITLDGGLDSATLRSLREGIDQLLGAGRCRILLDCAKLTYVSSAGIGAIVSLHRRVQETGGQLWIAGATGAVFEVLKLMNLGSILNLSDDVELATEAMGPTRDGAAG